MVPGPLSSPLGVHSFGNGNREKTPPEEEFRLKSDHCVGVEGKRNVSSSEEPVIPPDNVWCKSRLVVITEWSDSEPFKNPG